jgi:FHS family L-fucose permease-like MFS transporter
LGKDNYRGAFYTVTSLFFMWGFITVLVDSLIPRLREIFELSYFESGLVQFAFFMAYGILSLPSGFILSRIGYKRGMILGLITMGMGCLLFLPAAEYRIFGFFLLGYFILAGGMTILQVAANPFVSVLGPESQASSRLNLSQAFNSLGTTLAPMIGAAFILSDRILTSDEIAQLSNSERMVYLDSEAEAVQWPFFWIAGLIFALAVLIARARLPEVLGSEDKTSYREVLSHKPLLYGALGIFLYVGAEVAIGSYLVNYFLDMGIDEIIRNNAFLSRIAGTILSSSLEDIDSKGVVAAFVTFYWGGAMVGRFVGAYLTRLFKASNVLAFFALLAVTMLLLSQWTDGLMAMFSILAVGLFNSIMFPTIFTLSIDGMGDRKPRASGVLCTAIVGGAFIPPLYGLLTDSFGFKPALILLMICYAYIWTISRYVFGRHA